MRVRLRRLSPLVPLTVAAVASWLAACGRADPDAQLLQVRRWEDHRTLAGDSLLAVAREGTRDLRAVACRALGRIGDPSARETLEARLQQDDRPEVRREAAFALGILGDPDASGALARRLAGETDVDVLGQIALAMGRLGQAASAPQLHPLLSNRFPQVRERVVEALALLADSTSVPPLLEATRDATEGVVWRAAYALEKIPGETQVPRLVELTAPDQPRLVRRYAVRSLGRLGAAGASATLHEVLREPGAEWRLRVMALDALGRIGESASESVVAESLDDPHFHVRVAALQALGRMKARSQVHLVLDAREDPTVDVRAAAYEAIADCMEGRTFDLLQPGIADSSTIVVATCARRLGDSQDPRVGPLLISMLDGDPRAPVRVGAAEGLVAMGDRAPLPQLRQALFDEDWVVAAVAATGLGDLGDGGAVEPMLRASERKGPGREEVRLALFEALGKLGQERAVPLLRHALERESSVRQRIAARNALALLLPESEAAALPEERALRAEVREVDRSPRQPPVVARSRARQLILHTARGRVVLDLFADDAPQTVENFARLAEAGFFDGTSFHRVVPNFVVQGGDPHGSGWGDPGYTIRSEWNPRRYEEGTVGIAHSGKDTGGCQLFVCLSPQPHLEARYTIFGKVVTGMDVVERIQRGDRFDAEVVWAERQP